MSERLNKIGKWVGLILFPVIFFTMGYWLCDMRHRRAAHPTCVAAKGVVTCDVPLSNDAIKQLSDEFFTLGQHEQEPK
jgi:hypothetical protein